MTSSGADSCTYIFISWVKNMENISAEPLVIGKDNPKQ